MKPLTVNLPGREYDILIEGGLLNKAGEHIKSKNVFIITDENVNPLYSRRVEQNLIDNGITFSKYVLSPGEGTKSFVYLEKLLSAMAQSGIRRGDTVLALGGGVVGDISGLTAALYMRGTAFIQLPTTLLAQVDSSVGGKVAVNLPEGKNLAGAFYQPKLVISDVSALETLPGREFASGMAEVIKTAALSGQDFLNTLEKSGNRAGIQRDACDIIYRCCDYKRKIVEEDESDLSARMVLNFGHTYGHAIEKAGNFHVFNHGEAVAAGIMLAAKTGEALGMHSNALVKRLENLILGFGLPVTVKYPLNTLIGFMESDKKNSGGGITLVLLEDFGKPVTRVLSPREIHACLEGSGGE